LKDEFLAVVAHELRGPLAPILAAVKLLEVKGPSDPPLQKLRATIERQALQLSKLVDDLLEVGRLTAGKLRLSPASVELTEIVTQAVEGCMPTIERRGHQLQVHLPKRPVRLQADPARLIQVVSNLLANAAKYQQDGGRIELTVSASATTASIAVRDYGVGLAPEMLGRIFQRFVQVSSSHHRDEGGLGIGLSVVKAVVELHGGTVHVHSDGIGHGSEFVVRLPLSQEASAEQ
jgi:signal transduction histidine kinase